VSGRRSRDEGARTERAFAYLQQGQDVALTKIRGMYKPGADINVPLLAVDRAVEVKCRHGGLNERDVLIVKADQQEPLVVVRLSLAAEIAKRGAA
jgi:hypothetical protein